MNQPCECEYDFALVLSGISDLTTEVEDGLFEAGCDDATLSMQAGRAYLTFSRVAASLKDAILSAIRDIRKANVGAEVLRVDDCNLVTQSEIARHIGRTRQFVNQLIAGTRGPGGFPPPACHLADRAPLWLWCEVADWLWQNNMIKEDVLRRALHVAAINNVLELKQQKKLTPELTKELLELVEAEMAGGR